MERTGKASLLHPRRDLISAHLSVDWRVVETPCSVSRNHISVYHQCSGRKVDPCATPNDTGAVSWNLNGEQTRSGHQDMKRTATQLIHIFKSNDF